MTYEKLYKLINQIKAKTIQKVSDIFEEAEAYIKGCEDCEDAMRVMNMQELSKQFKLYENNKTTKTKKQRELAK